MNLESVNIVTGWKDLPEEMQLSIFKYCSPKDRLQSMRVSKSWERVLKDNTIWQQHGFKGFDDFVKKVKQFPQPFKKLVLENPTIIERISEAIRDKNPEAIHDTLKSLGFDYKDRYLGYAKTLSNLGLYTLRGLVKPGFTAKFIDYNAPYSFLCDAARDNVLSETLTVEDAQKCVLFRNIDIIVGKQAKPLIDKKILPVSVAASTHYYLLEEFISDQARPLVEKKILRAEHLKTIVPYRWKVLELFISDEARAVVEAGFISGESLGDRTLETMQAKINELKEASAIDSALRANKNPH